MRIYEEYIAKKEKSEKKRKTTKLTRKWAKALNRIFFQLSYPNGQWVHENVFSITNHQGSNKSKLQ